MQMYISVLSSLFLYFLELKNSKIKEFLELDNFIDFLQKSVPLCFVWLN